ncbi:beta-galactosidase [Shimia sp. R9_2]|uniref:beta-galactosidase n=1 Tax=Shimia sp. R9_2 TaxID=2821112 RepID=UPI001ADAD873|nr:beta-galactosidase [Shimia sp. R9_2]MBO9397816.1 beta-galactosidase [Shimia sp. R9_2]
MKQELGVCYYPEHWPEEMWAKDAADMIAAGITWVRIGEFAWSRMEAVAGTLSLEWLDRAIDVLGSAGLKVVLGTPTATPPRWMIDKHPDMLAVDENGNPRKFGSRRHYCFSHEGFKAESARITKILAERYGKNPYVAAWQTDNEYGCHDTIISYSEPAKIAFQAWCKARYGTVETLNEAWGNIFWSMEYFSFDQIDLPNLTVTEPNPTHVLAFRRFSSDQVVAFNKVQTDILRAHTDAPLIHNYMGRILEFDHFDVGEDLDIASWDSYPIGFLSDRLEASEDHKARFLRQGDPDMQAFHHDLYRAVGKGRWWVMEQQPGPVNWAPYNPAPLPGMVALWSLEAFAHGAEVVSYFRWRQAPFAQEQMHAGLQTPDGREAPGMDEARAVAKILAALPPQETQQAEVALVFDYPSDWAWHTQPQGAGFDYFRLMFSAYRGLRRAGLSVDIVSASCRDFAGYKAVFAPGVATVDPAMVEAVRTAGAQGIYGPRTGAITEDFFIPAGGRPEVPGLDVRVELIESMPPHAGMPVAGGGMADHWHERLSGAAEVLLATEAGAPVLMGQGDRWYLGSFPDDALWDRLVAMVAEKAGFAVSPVPEGLRKRRFGELEFVINYNGFAENLGDLTVPACGVAVLKDGAPIAVSDLSRG